MKRDCKYCDKPVEIPGRLTKHFPEQHSACLQRVLDKQVRENLLDRLLKVTL